MKQYEYWLYAYQQCLPADKYIVRMVCPGKKRKTQPRTYTYQQLWNSRKYLWRMNQWRMNQKGYHIYARPDDYRFILIDDIGRDKLKLLMELKPTIVMETSPNNFQAFLNLKQIPPMREDAVRICRELCSLFEGDFGSAEPDHVGRLPGFFNLKPEYGDSNGGYPLVKLHYALDQFSSFIPQGREAKGGVGTYRKNHSFTKRANDRSSQDFAIAMKMLEGGFSDNEIFNELIRREKGRERGEEYVWRTINNGKKKILGRNAFRKNNL